MIHTPYIGIIYDIIYYGVIYYNKEAVKQVFTKDKCNLDEVFTFFEIVKNLCKPLPRCLLPFFYYKPNYLSVLSNYLKQCLEESKNLHYFRMTDYLDSIQNKKKFEDSVYKRLFENLDEEDLTKLIKGDVIIQNESIDNKDWPDEMKLRTAMLFNNFSKYADILYDYLREIEKHVFVLHKKNDNKILKCTRETKDKEMLSHLGKYFSLTEEMAETQHFTTCFIHQFIYWRIVNKKREKIYIFGNKIKETLKKKSLAERIDIYDLLNILSDPTKRSILKTINDNGKLAMIDVARLTYISKSTVSPILNYLYEKNIILESHKTGQKIFYYINKECFNSSIEDYIAIAKEFSQPRGGNDNATMD